MRRDQNPLAGKALGNLGFSHCVRQVDQQVQAGGHRNTWSEGRAFEGGEQHVSALLVLPADASQVPVVVAVGQQGGEGVLLEGAAAGVAEGFLEGLLQGGGDVRSHPSRSAGARVLLTEPRYTTRSGSVARVPTGRRS